MRLIGGIDLATAALVGGGAALIFASLVAGAMFLAPAAPTETEASPTTTSSSGRATQALPTGQVAALLQVEAAAGAGSAARMGDHVDILGYFPRQMTGQENVTRVLLRDVAVLGVDRSGAGVALTLAVPQQEALLLQEAQALGAHPYVALRPANQAQDTAPSPAFSDSDLGARLAGRR